MFLAFLVVLTEKKPKTVWFEHKLLDSFQPA